MNFHFKQALEEVKRLQTIEGYAETILRSSIKKLHDFKFSDIDVIHFAIIKPESLIYPRIYVFVRYRKTRNFSQICMSNFYIEHEETLSVFEAIEKHLRDEGYDCKHVEQEPAYCNCIKAFQIYV